MKTFIEMKSATAPVDIEKKSLTFEIKAVDDETNIVEGYASTFGGEPDAYDDVIVKGAFAKTIQENGDRIKFLWQHNWDKPIGKVIELREDEIGLYFKAKISETNKGKEAMQLMKDRVIDRLSIGYNTIKREYDSETGIRYLKEISLFEISAVTFPANDRAIITAAKNAPEQKAGRVLSKQSEKAVREAVEAMKAAVESLESLLSAVEPDDSGDDSKGKNFTKDEQKEIASLVEQMKMFAKVGD
ncbi:HK97 family phage prohead protease [Bacillus sp. FJAT-52991]|uniref:HK97 family phage prohead protease n=1 Tax=Bacillus kandeliae TaxID=3129297 RepID=A0ABZ2N328_9BACI